MATKREVFINENADKPFVFKLLTTAYSPLK